MKKTIALLAMFVASSALAQDPQSQETYDYYSGYGSIPVGAGMAGGLMLGFGQEGRKGFYSAVDLYLVSVDKDMVRQVTRSLGYGDDLGDLISAKVIGLSVPIGYAIAKTEKFSIIPVGIIGNTWVRGCALGICASESDLNYGAGAVSRIMVSKRFGIHVGGRYTKHVAAISVGFTVGSKNND